jgi:hypothetical protein
LKISNFKFQISRSILCLVLLVGCRPSQDSAPTGHAAGSAKPATSAQYHNELLTYALDNLNRLEEFDSAEALQQVLERLNTQATSEAGQSDRTDRLLAAWPEPEMLRQIVDRLNQWIRGQQPPADWKLDPMLAELPKPLADLPQVKDLGGMEFSRFDGYALQEAVWLRDVGLWARGEALHDLERAKSLFDWTVRNIQLEADSPRRIPQFPWEALLFGRGTAAERAWVFILLARQSGIDAAMLGLETGKEIRPWCVAVLIEGRVYLFDPLLGLQIPAPDGVTRDQKGQLAIRPATLDQIVADGKLLRQMDANENHLYPVKKSDLKHVAVMLEASPTYLAKRMKLLESRLAGPQKMVLTTSPSSQAERWKTLPNLSAVRLWTWPFETLDRRRRLDPRGVQARLAMMLPFYAKPGAPLRRGRVLQLKGKFVGEDGATNYYQAARPSNEEVSASSAHVFEKLVYLRGKQDATYWLGLIAYQRGNYPSAVHYFARRTLELAANGPWSDGARYNLARTFEAAGDPERAILQYSSNGDSPGYLGDLLRAKWLKRETDKSDAKGR